MPESPTNLIRRAVWAGSVLVLLVGAVSAAWLCDDSFIAFRYSRNFADGLGLRYNLGVEPPVEGYTQLGWILWVGVLDWLGLDPRLWSRVTTIAAACGLLVAVLSVAERRLRLGALGLAVTGLFFATAPTVVVWSTGGLGTMVFALAVFLACERLLGDPERPRLQQAALAAVAVCLLRADGPYWLALTYGLGAWFALRTGHKALLRGIVSCGVVVVLTVAVIVAFRLWYHGDWLPNTARTKVSMGPQTLLRGARYVAHYWMTVPAMFVVLVGAAFGGLRRDERWLRLCAGIVAGTALYAVLVSGDFMSMGRFMLPAVAFAALAAGILVDRLGRTPLLAGSAAVVLLVTSFPAGLGVHLTPEAWRRAVQFRYGTYISEPDHWQRMIDNCDRWTDEGRALAAYADPGSSVVRAAIGAVGYYSRLHIFDSLGLVNREVATQVPVDPEHLKSPGHDRVAPRGFFDAFEPTYTDARIYYADDAGIGKIVASLRGNPNPNVEVHEIRAADGYARDGYLLLRRRPR